MQQKSIAESKPEELKLAILRFSWLNGVNISPEKNLDKFVARQKSVNHCACKNDRLTCPCKQAASEISEQGYCCCHLFIDNTELTLVQNRIRVKIRENPEYRPDK